MECRKCNHKNEPDARFCSACGASLTAADKTTVSIPLFDDSVSAANEHQETVASIDPTGAILVARRGPNAGSSFSLAAAVTTLGRSPESDIFLDDVTVSREHAVVERTGDDYRIRDCDSLNGTYIDHERVQDEALAESNEIQVGRFVFTFMRGRKV